MTVTNPLNLILREVENRGIAKIGLDAFIGNILELDNFSTDLTIERESLNSLNDILKDSGLQTFPKLTTSFVSKSPRAVVYAFKNEGAIDQKAQPYRYGSVCMRLAVISVTIDHELIDAERDSVESVIENLNFLTPREKTRLNAQANYLMDCFVSSYSDSGDTEFSRVALNPENIKERLSQLDQKTVRKALDIAIKVIASDGKVRNSEVNLLKSLYKATGLPTRSARQDLIKVARQQDLTFSPIDPIPTELVKTEEIIDDMLGGIMGEFF